MLCKKLVSLQTLAAQQQRHRALTLCMASNYTSSGMSILQHQHKCIWFWAQHACLFWVALFSLTSGVAA